MKMVIDQLKRQDLDGLLLVNKSNVRYVTGFTGDDSFVLLLEDKTFFLTDYRYAEQAQNECSDCQLITVNRDFETLEDIIANLASTYHIKRLAFENIYFTYSRYKSLKSKLTKTKLIPTENIVENIRYTKSELEINLIRKACQIADKAFEKILKVLKPGITEKEAALELEYYIRRDDAENIGSSVILVSGTNTSKPHGIPSNKKIENGDFVTMDFGALCNGYRSDMTRTVVVGKPSKKQVEVYESVKKAQNTGVTGIKSGASSMLVNRQVEEVLLKDNYLNFAGKGIGHGVGLDIHERPFFRSSSDEELKENCVVTMEPGIYIPSWGGVRIEDTVLVQKNGCEVLSKSPKELIIL